MSQVYEVSNELVEVREEAELLRLQMEVAQQEEEAARNALAACQAALAAALVGPAEPEEPEASQVRLVYHAQHGVSVRAFHAHQTVALNCKVFRLHQKPRCLARTSKHDCSDKHGLCSGG